MLVSFECVHVIPGGRTSGTEWNCEHMGLFSSIQMSQEEGSTHLSSVTQTGLDLLFCMSISCL